MMASGVAYPLIPLHADLPTAVGAAITPDDMVIDEFTEFLARQRPGQRGGQYARRAEQ